MDPSGHENMSNETNPLPAGYHDEHAVDTLDWTSPDLACIERLRLLSDPGYPAWDVSYCIGRNLRGDKVRVALPFSELPKRGFKNAIVKFAKRDKVYAVGLGLFDSISTLC